MANIYVWRPALEAIRTASGSCTASGPPVPHAPVLHVTAPRPMSLLSSQSLAPLLYPCRRQVGGNLPRSSTEPKSDETFDRTIGWTFDLIFGWPFDQTAPKGIRGRGMTTGRTEEIGVGGGEKRGSQRPPLLRRDLWKTFYFYFKDF
jgi:hypothetical protein